jgi:phosphoribosylformimino-5-aminoimidazole carboxamide ribotide isomerase
MEVIPAIDIRGGRCVRLAQGDYARETVFADDPVAMARRWVAAGATRLHVVDLDGAREGRPVNIEAVRAIAAAAPCPVQTGGGIRDLAAVRALLDAGVARVVLGTAAVKAPDLVRAALAAAGERLIVSVDARDGRVRTEGWTEGSDLAASALVDQLAALGVRRIVYTDISRDGVTGGPNLDAYAPLVARGDLAVIAAGGVSTLDDVRALARCGVEAAIIGRALYTGELALAAALEAAC